MRFEKGLAIALAVFSPLYAVAVVNGHEPTIASTLLNQATITVLALLWAFEEGK